MSSIEDLFKNYFGAYKNTSKYKDSAMLEIALKKNEFEKNLDDMWDIYKKKSNSDYRISKGYKPDKKFRIESFQKFTR